MTPDERAALREQAERAHSEIARLCSAPVDSRWRMSIPANPERDSDLILSDALTALERALDAETERADAAEDVSLVAGRQAAELGAENVALRRERNEARAEVERLTRMVGALGFCVKDGESLPCLTCGAGL